MRRETKAHAKINLTLRITGRRDDGYHLLESVITQIGLYDEVAVTPQDGGINLRVEHGALSAGPDNLAWAAAAAFLAETGIKSGVHIELKKNIPVGAGFAGGSADAAAVLNLMNEMFDFPINKEGLISLAASLGADVPFCLSGGCALMRGIGEELEPAPGMPACSIVLCKPGFSVSAHEAYTRYDRMEEELPLAPGSLLMLDALERGSLADLSVAAFNALEEPVVQAYPEIGEIKRMLLAQGALCAWMSGSGSAVYGIFADAGAAEKAYAGLRMRYPETFLTGPRTRD